MSQKIILLHFVRNKTAAKRVRSQVAKAKKVIEKTKQQTAFSVYKKGKIQFQWIKPLLSSSPVYDQSNMGHAVVSNCPSSAAESTNPTCASQLPGSVTSTGDAFRVEEEQQHAKVC